MFISKLTEWLLSSRMEYALSTIFYGMDWLNILMLMRRTMRWFVLLYCLQSLLDVCVMCAYIYLCLGVCGRESNSRRKVRKDNSGYIWKPMVWYHHLPIQIINAKNFKWFAISMCLTCNIIQICNILFHGFK